MRGGGLHIAPWTRRVAPPQRSSRPTAAPRCWRWRGRARARAAALGTSRRARSPPAPWSGAPAVPPCWPPAEHRARQHRHRSHRPLTHRPPTHRPPTHRPPTPRAAAAVVRASHPTLRCWSPHPPHPAPLPCAAGVVLVAVPEDRPHPSASRLLPPKGPRRVPPPTRHEAPCLAHCPPRRRRPSAARRTAARRRVRGQGRAPAGPCRGDRRRGEGASQAAGHGRAAYRAAAAPDRRGTTARRRRATPPRAHTAAVLGMTVAAQQAMRAAPRRVAACSPHRPLQKAAEGADGRA